MNDLISRQAVLNKKELVELEDGQSFYCISPEDVETLPPVTPQPEQGNEVNPWRERAKKYEDIIADLVAEQAKGVKLDSIEITGGSIIFKKSRPKSKTYSKADYIMALHKEYGCTLKRAEEAHNKALEYLRSKATMKG